MRNKKNYFKMILDLAMSVTFVLLFNKRVFGGMAFHEIAGVSLGIAAMLHIGLNFKFVQKITMRIFDKSLPGKTRFSYFLNILLLITMLFVMVSGLLISKVLLPHFRYGNANWFKMTHTSVAYLCLVLIGVHVGLHWHWVMKVSQRMLHLKMPKAAARALMLSMAIVIFAYGGYQIYSTGFISKLQRVQNVFSTTTPVGEHGGMDKFGGKPVAAAGASAASTSAAATANGASASATSSADGSAAANASANVSNTEPASPSATTSSTADASGSRGQMSIGGFKGGFQEGGRDGGSVNFISVLLTNMGIMAVFTVITYYLDKWLSRRRKRTIPESAAPVTA